MTCDFIGCLRPAVVKVWLSKTYHLCQRCRDEQAVFLGEDTIKGLTLGRV